MDSPTDDESAGDCGEESAEAEMAPFPGAPILEVGERAYGYRQYQGGSEVSFTVILNCRGRGTTQEKTLVVKGGMPLRVRDLKSCIEEEYSIPVCCQNLVLESVVMEDRVPLEVYRVRDGDIMHVNYVSGGNVLEILDVVDHMTKTYYFVESIQADLNAHKVSDDLDTLLNQSIHWEKVNGLAEVYFNSHTLDKAEANRNLFIQCGGLDMLQRLHTLLLRQPWSNTPIMMQYLEHAILRTYWNITAAFNVRMYVLQYPRALDNILRSFLRVELKKDTPIVLPKNIYATRQANGRQQGHVAAEVVCKAMGALCK